MKYESAKTEKGNVGVSYDSQEAADLQATQMDETGNTNCYGCSRCSGCTDCTGCRFCTGCHGCTDCHDCHGCTGCHGCTDCHDCNGCRYCANCTGCSGCSGCRYCHGCLYCSGCSDCSGCSGCLYCSGCSETHGALRWNGEPAKNLLSINGLRWSVSTDGKSIQIGCQHHSVDEWRAFDDRVIAKMDEEALTFWKKYKLVVLDLAEVRKNMEEES